jgi:hypothetical protein
MELEGIVRRLCSMPADFYRVNKSMVQLTRESGVRDQPGAVTVQKIVDYISENPVVIDAWLRWSANKRASSGWFFRKKSAKYEVGYFPGGEVLEYSSPAVACAEFVVREVKTLLEAEPETR